MLLQCRRRSGIILATVCFIVVISYATAKKYSNQPGQSRQFEHTNADDKKTVKEWRKKTNFADESKRSHKSHAKEKWSKKYNSDRNDRDELEGIRNIRRNGVDEMSAIRHNSKEGGLSNQKKNQYHNRKYEKSQNKSGFKRMQGVEEKVYKDKKKQSHHLKHHSKKWSKYADAENIKNELENSAQKEDAFLGTESKHLMIDTNPSNDELQTLVVKEENLDSVEEARAEKVNTNERKLEKKLESEKTQDQQEEITVNPEQEESLLTESEQEVSGATKCQHDTDCQTGYCCHSGDCTEYMKSIGDKCDAVCECEPGLTCVFPSTRSKNKKKTKGVCVPPANRRHK